MIVGLCSGGPDIKRSFRIEFGRFYFDNKPFIGKLADINVWNRILEKEEFERFSDCLNVVEGRGNMINSDFRFNITGKLITKAAFDTEEISCKRMSLHLPMPFPQADFDSAREFCDKIEKDSIGPRIRSEEDFLSFEAALYQSVIYKTICWHGTRILTYIPYIASPLETEFLYVVDNSVLPVNYWIVPPKPLNHTSVIIGYMGPAMPSNASLYQSSYKDFPKDYEWSPCFSCNLNHNHRHSVVLKLTGQCAQSAFDTFFQIQMDSVGSFIFYGFRGTVIRYEKESKMWNMTVLHFPAAFATSKAEFKTLVLGNHQWNIHNDDACSNDIENKVLTMSTCSKEQYTCNDGQCVNLDFRCDGRPHCKDKSDELDCRIIEVDRTYQKFLAPPPAAYDEEGTKLIVEMNVEISAIGDIKEIESTIDFQFTLYLTWFESRLKYANLAASKSNRLVPSEVDYLWLPKLIFFNTEDRLMTEVDKRTIVSITRAGEPKLLENKNQYAGGENPITSSRFYNQEFVCIFDMRWYPFDTQKCSMQFVVDEESKDFVELEMGNLDFTGAKELTQYFVKKEGVKKTVDRINNRHFIQVEIVLGRRLLSLILTIFAPTIILNLVGHLSNFFKEFFFEATISVNVTVMLVLTTMFISVSSNLPKTSYIKMIDIWLLTSLVKPFLDILLQTYIDNLRVDENRDIQHHGTSINVGAADEGDRPPRQSEDERKQKILKCAIEFLN